MLARVLIVTLALFATVYAHMEMVAPPPRGSKYNKLWTGAIDYSNTAPLSGPAAFPCQGKPAGASVQTYKAGGSIDVEIGGSAVHGGGHCEFSVRYPGQDKFLVLQRVLGTCLTASKTYSIPLPATMPSCEDCVFAWSWINAVGNREYYMNCADINIDGVTGGTITGDELLVGNLAGLGPSFPEWGNGGSDNRQYYDNRPKVTVNGSGSGSGDTPTTVPAPTDAPAPSDVPTAPAPTDVPAPTAAPTDAPAPAPAPTTAPSTGAGRCTEGQKYCNRRGMMMTCTNGRWKRTGYQCR